LLDLGFAFKSLFDFPIKWSGVYTTTMLFPSDARNTTAQTSKSLRCVSLVGMSSAPAGSSPDSRPKRPKFAWMSSWPARNYICFHDWGAKFVVLNGYLHLCLEDGTEEKDAEEYYGIVRETLKFWPTYRALASRLAETYEADMTPALLLETGPLAGFPPATLSWLRPLIHESWVTSFPVRQKIEALIESLVHTDQAFSQLALFVAGPLPRCAASRDECREIVEKFNQEFLAIRKLLIDLEYVPVLSRSLS
jgi:hypothetical protein